MGLIKFMWFLLFLTAVGFGDDLVLLRQAQQNRDAMRFCWRLLQGWLQFADEETKFFPRNLKTDFFWNAKDCSADNYPFLTLTAYFTDRLTFETTMKQILANEQRFCNRVDRLPDDWDFETRGFRNSKVEMPSIIFGASEYIKDGLLPLTEYLGRSLWSERMYGLMDDIWKHASIETEVGLLPDKTHEVAGDLMQALARIYWQSRDEKYKKYAFMLGDYFLVYHPPHKSDYLQLDDHGCEVIGGLSEVYLLAKYEDETRYISWKNTMHELIDTVLKFGRNEKGLFYEAIDPNIGAIKRDALTDNWGYDYNAIATVGLIDGKGEYIEEIKSTLDNLIDFKDYPWEEDGADGLADSLEGAINLFNRFPSEYAFAWADYTAERLLSKQRPSGIIEGWYGDGNSARTMLMYALWKSQGCYVEPWRADIGVGAVKNGDGTVDVIVTTEWRWKGKLKFDIPRHKENFNMPFDYPRLNQFPEWFTVESGKEYQIEIENQASKFYGEQLREGLPLALPANGTVRIKISPIHLN
ncbi:MAG: hypothetical protein N3G21_06890 [Candidatus Hydrogenedentes bacterium]|nr:hypothetical protein [Candidatus Hydrogenedentota bacterium]